MIMRLFKMSLTSVIYNGIFMDEMISVLRFASK